jgi:hypothetical protein
MKHLKQSEERISNIVDALHSARSGQEIFDALSQVPTENLTGMQDMIETILRHRQLT